MLRNEDTGVADRYNDRHAARRSWRCWSMRWVERDEGEMHDWLGKAGVILYYIIVVSSSPWDGYRDGTGVGDFAFENTY